MMPSSRYAVLRSAALFDQLQHLTGLCMPAELVLREDECAVDHHLERPSAALD